MTSTHSRVVALLAAIAFSFSPVVRAADAAAPAAPAAPVSAGAPAAASVAAPAAAAPGQPVAAADAKPRSTVPSGDNFGPRIGYQISYSDYLATKRGRAVDLIFIGDSITEMFRWNIGWEVWLRHYENRALNFGLGSDRTEHALWRLDNIDLTPWAPKVAVVLIGTNNFRDTPDDIAAGVKAVVEQTKALFSGIKVIVVSILPNARAAERMAAANQLIAKLANGKDVFYLDLAAKFPRDEQANSWKGLARDKLHLTEEGYETWAQAVDAMLPELLK